MDPYATHQPVTALALRMTGELFPSMPILECGCGDYSSPLIWALKGKRRHIIYSADPLWSARFEGMADVVYVPLAGPKKWNDVAWPSGWGLALMDSEESVANRIRHIPALLDAAKVVVMHDAREDMIPEARHSAAFTVYRPWTWIGSNEVDVAAWFR